jgi:hypothetical protein
MVTSAPALTDNVSDVRLIGLYSDTPGSGKTAFARALEADGYVRVPFAETMKAMAALLLEAVGYAPELIDELLSERKEVPLDALDGITTRRILQTLGTDWGRKLHPEVWLRCWTGKVEAHLRAGRRCIADDMRFPNEAELIRCMGGALVRIQRPAAAAGPHGDALTLSHVSEGGLRDWAFDAEVLNNATLEKLCWQARMLVRQLED